MVYLIKFFPVIYFAFPYSAGGIGKLTTLLGEHGASIKDMYHERAFLQSNIDFVKVKCVVELQGLEHAERIDKVLVENGYEPVWDGD
jgi:threonine dehydratase